MVPSSEVAVLTEDPAPAWREEAGSIRAMIKVYSLVTLLWALPLRFLIGMIEALAAPLVGRWTLLTWLRSWLWNLGLLPSTIGARRALRKNAVVGDAELFRYQLRGSAALKSIWSEIVDAARIRFPVDDGSGIGSIAKELKTPAFALGVTAVLFGLISTRQIWSGFPAGRFSLPLPPRGADAVAAYAGGWNPAGFGSAEQLPPFVGLAGVWQQVLFDNPDLAAGSLVLAAFLGGIWGMVRLLQTWSVGTVAGILAGVALMAGPAARTIAGSGDAATLIGLGVVPWVVLLAVAPWPATWLRRLGRLLAAGSVTGLMANLSPELIVLPVAALVIKVAVDAGAKPTLIAAAVAGIGGVIALALLRPWVGAVDLDGYLGGADAYWVPGTLLLAAASIAALVVVLAAPGPLARLGAWGALVAAAGGLVARTASEGGGRHVAAVGLAAVALGTAVIVGAVLEAARNREATVSTRSLLAIGGLAGLLVVASSVLILAPGRAGLPGDDLAAALRFTGASVEDSSSARVLLVGPPESLPGTSRRVRGAAYRVVSAPLPALWELDLPSAGPADEALEAVLESVIDGGAFRAGEQLADFGIRWILEMGETPLSASFVGQLDLIPLDGLRRPAFLVDSERAVRAISVEGDIWSQAGTGYEGAPSAAVLVRESADPRWGPDGEPGDWAMTLDGSSGMVEYEPRPGGSAAIVSLWGGLGMFLASAVLRRRR